MLSETFYPPPPSHSVQQDRNGEYLKDRNINVLFTPESLINFVSISFQNILQKTTTKFPDKSQRFHIKNDFR